MEEHGAEPAAWQVTRSDSTAALQAAGSVGVSSMVPTSANAYPVKVSFTELTVTDPSRGSAAGEPAPVAAFTSTVSGLGVVGGWRAEHGFRWHGRVVCVGVR